jgi:hypothetical protein
LIGRKRDRWSLIDSDLGRQFVIFLPIVGDPLKHFHLGRPVQPVMSFTVLNHERRLDNFTGFWNEQFQPRQQNLPSVQSSPQFFFIWIDNFATAYHARHL